ncbi:chymotrypsin-1-like [Trichoplusia ni]|uniref:Chymotrypsin-1-like n=1 Tax=Trichoplusia ni TaxID=7111 RepID=A0A7E5WWL6_TRINI|nr:chymotrypsin-1-like [Trichoplusia ni]
MTMVKILKLISFVNLVFFPTTDTTNFKQTLLKRRQNRVHMGRDLTAGEYPYVILLIVISEEESTYARACTGSMITATWGITASHCLQTKNFGRNLKTYVAYDNFTVSPIFTGLYVPVIETFLHPSYCVFSTNGGKNDIIVNNDVGLFRSENVPKKSYAVLLATEYSTLVGLPVVYVGGGRTKMEPDYMDAFRPLQVGEATIINCDEKMRSKSKFVICLAPKCSNRLETIWYGDSGGPLIYDGKIIGVASYIIEHKIIKRMGYAPVSPYVDWISSVMNGHKR